MATLYQLLGLSEQATPEQIEQGYVVQSEKLAMEGLPADQAQLRQLAIKEAFAVLSSPSRRANYDERQRRASQVSYEVVEKKPLPWAAIVITAVLLGGVLAYQMQKQAREARIEEMARQTALAQAEVEKMARLAEVEKARAEQQRLSDARRQEAIERSELAESRREGERVRRDLDMQAQQQAAQNARSAREQEYAQQRLRESQMREEQQARYHNEQREAALKRALALRVRVPD